MFKKNPYHDLIFFDIKEGKLFILKDIPKLNNTNVPHMLFMFKFSGQVKEHFRVLLLRVDASLRGVRSSLRDFEPPSEEYIDTTLAVAGAVGASVGSSKLREKTADTLQFVFS